MELTIKKRLPGGKISLLLAALCGIFLLFSCSNPTSSDPGDPDPDPALNPPQQVSVELVDQVMRVSWSSVPGIGQYQVFRREGVSDYELITPSFCSGTQYDDDDYEAGELLEYTVVSCRDDRRSRRSDPSNKISRYVLGMRASRFAYTVGSPDPDTGGQILISWDKHPRATSYRVYRYRSQAESPEAVMDTENTFLGDGGENGIQAGVPYYYRVSWKRWSREYGKDGPFAIGIFSDTIDKYEPNDDYRLLIDETASTVFIPSQPPIAYSLVDSQAGRLQQDVDWYKYYGDPQAFTVEVELPNDTPFGDGELEFQFFYNQRESGPARKISTTPPNSFIFSNFGGATEKVTVYFKVYPEVTLARNVFGSYLVRCTEGGF